MAPKSRIQTITRRFICAWVSGFSQHYEDYEPAVDQLSMMRIAMHEALIGRLDDANKSVMLFAGWQVNHSYHFALFRFSKCHGNLWFQMCFAILQSYGGIRCCAIKTHTFVGRIRSRHLGCRVPAAPPKHIAKSEEMEWNILNRFYWWFVFKADEPLGCQLQTQSPDEHNHRSLLQGQIPLFSSIR